MLKSPTSPTQPPSLGLRKPFRSPLLKRPPLAGHDACPRPARVLGTSLKRVFPIAKNAADVGTPPKRVKESTEVRSSLPPSTMPWQSRKVFAAFKSPLRVPLSASSDTASSQSDSNQDSPGGAAMGAIPSKHLGVRRKALIRRGPRHDPKAEGAIVLYTPPTPEELMLRKQKEQQDASKKSKSLESILNKARDGESEEVAVVLDPVIGRKLRPHQVDGVKFMFDCVTGRKVENAYGCIMADEMGLGKTLQCIALLWTLLKQSPNPGKVYIEKCVIACPSSLVKNWANELVKWLGSTRIQPLVSDGLGTKLKSELRHFITSHGRMNLKPVLIISYETLRANIDILKVGKVGLLLCDEGHRLKNSASQTFQALNSLNVQRRVILSGTPIQNDLTEYFSLLNFANPGLLGTPGEFRKTYENPILRGRDADATPSERLESDRKLAELTALANKVIIRRTNDLLSKYLPIKYEHVVFCSLSLLQVDLYTKYLSTKAVKRVLSDGGGGGGSGDSSLQAVTLLKKLCNHPNLLRLPAEIEGSEGIIPPEYYADKLESAAGGGGFARRKAADTAMRGMGSGAVFHPKWSGKMALLDRMLRRIQASPDRDKVVFISNYTQTLDLFEKLCQARGYGYHRLDGTMQISKRQKMVEQFNNPSDRSFVFLLSSKAGGCGINLVGANRLVLFDPDWNPASDQQALARVWRDGQKKTCYIYRFVATGTIEEKIFQRQSHKLSLSSCVVDERMEVERHFSREQMRQLFEAKIKGETQSDTHDTFRCKRCIKGKQFRAASEPMDYGDTSTWNHYSHLDSGRIYDDVLRSCLGNDVSYVFQYKSH